MGIEKADVLGSALALFILTICSLIFIFRIFRQHKIEYLLGIVFLLTALPLTYLLLTAYHFQRTIIYFVQIAVILVFIMLELFLDYLLKIDFRNIPWMRNIYVTIFFAGTGGMIGIASQSGIIFTSVSIIIFFIMTFLAFYQHWKIEM